MWFLLSVLVWLVYIAAVGARVAVGIPEFPVGLVPHPPCQKEPPLAALRCCLSGRRGAFFHRRESARTGTRIVSAIASFRSRGGGGNIISAPTGEHPAMTERSFPSEKRPDSCRWSATRKGTSTVTTASMRRRIASISSATVDPYFNDININRHRGGAMSHTRRDRKTGRGTAVAAAAGTAVSETVTRSLVFWENMICGAISRSVAQTIMHPANTMKTILQNSPRGPDSPTIATLLLPKNFQRLTVGAGTNFLLSLPHGAVNFAVLEYVRKRLAVIVQSNPRFAANEERWAFGLDFLSSSISTVACSIVSTPQMMITDNIMVGNYRNLPEAISGLAKSKGLGGFYGGWWPGLVGKIPSYALTWTFFQRLKNSRNRWTNDRPATDIENSAMGCMASAATVCLMIPIDTIKTRLVAQAGRATTDRAYKGIVDCAVRVYREEGLISFYRGLPPRLVGVVPMIGIQFGVYEFMKRVMLQRQTSSSLPNPDVNPDVLVPVVQD